MRRFLFLLLAIFLFDQTAIAATLVSRTKTSVTGAHGMLVTEDGGVILADTYNSLKQQHSYLYLVRPNGRLQTINLAGVGLAGIEKTSSGYLICDLQGSAIYAVDENFRLQAQWSVPNPWVAKQDSSGNVFVLTYGGQFLQLLNDSEAAVLIDDLDAPFDFAFTENGIWISEQGAADGRVSLWRVDDDHYERALDSNYGWSNPEGLVYLNGDLWVLDTELGLLVRVRANGDSTEEMNGLGIPILIKSHGNALTVYSNDYQGSPSLLQIQP